MRIPEEKIDEIRNAADIVDVVSKYVPLKKAGANFKALCPFHHEKTPSFVVSPQKQIFNCFSCHIGGNVFKFLMEFNKVSFVEAVKEVADEVGIPLELERGDSGRESEREQFYEINVEAARFYSDALLKGDEGKAAREYLEGRGVPTKIMRVFGLGYAPDEWRALTERLDKRGHDLEKAATLGLIGKNDRGYYDKMRGRIVFPILSTNGRVVAFAGRATKADDRGPKYVNSPENPIYHKSSVLYGMFHAKEDIRKADSALAVEGYMDVVALWKSGVKNVVAVSGTALTEDQARLLSRFAKSVKLLFDADSAGVRAAMRSVEILLREGLSVRVVSLPEGEDPDSFVNERGAEAFRKEEENARNFFEFMAGVYEKEGRFADPDSLAEAVRELVKPVAFVSDDLKRAAIIKAIAERFGLRERLLESELEKTTRSTRRERRPPEKQPTRGESAPTDAKPSPRERDLVKILYEGERRALDFVFDRVQPDEFRHSALRALAAEAFEIWREGGLPTPSNVGERLHNEELERMLYDLAEMNYDYSEALDAMGTDNRDDVVFFEAIDTVKRFKVDRLDKERSALAAELANAFESDDQRRILQELAVMDREKKIAEEEFEAIKERARNAE
jgi:DNA primase